jgi:hypothetical protein
MICTWGDCGGKMKVTHTYGAGTSAKTQRLRCLKCKRVTTAVTMYSKADGYGKGAAAQAKKLKDCCEKKPSSS